MRLVLSDMPHNIQARKGFFPLSKTLCLSQKGEVHAERASLRAWRGRFLGEKNWEREVTVGKGKGKTSTGLGTSRTNLPIVLSLLLNFHN